MLSSVTVVRLCLFCVTEHALIITTPLSYLCVEETDSLNLCFALVI